MKASFFSAMLAAFMLATASVGGITASAAERASAGEDTAETTAVDEDSSADTTETTADTAESSDTEETSSVSDESDDMEKFREVMSDLAEAGATEVAPDYYGDDYYDTDGNATLIKSERIVYNSEEMQFIAVTTKDGHVFYVLINYSAQNADDQVFFLNKVDDYDLYTLLNDGNNSDNSVEDYEKQNGTAFGKTTSSIDESENAVETTTSTAAASSSSKSGNKNMMIILCVVVVIGAGAAIFFFKFKKKKSTVPNDDLDFDEYDEDEDGDE